MQLLQFTAEIQPKGVISHSGWLKSASTCKLTAAEAALIKGSGDAILVNYKLFITKEHITSTRIFLKTRSRNFNLLSSTFEESKAFISWEIAEQTLLPILQPHATTESSNTKHLSLLLPTWGCGSRLLSMHSSGEWSS